MKRFYTDVTLDGRSVLLDGKPIRTPARAPLTLPTPALAEAVAAEWAAQDDRIDPRAMPMTGYANAAIDRVAPDPADFAAPLAAYAEADLFCYRATEPPALVERQAAAWDPWLAWARARYDVAFAVTAGIGHVPQPPATIARLQAALSAFDPFALTALSPLVTIGGSLVAALAVAEGAIEAGEAFAVTHLDELWQAEQWGEDWMAADARAAREADFRAAAHFLNLSRTER
ncbi:MAG: ATPase [Sphingomonas fennica]